MSAAARRHPLRTRPASTSGALGLLVSVWAALALGPALAGPLGRGPALLASFGLAGALCAVDAAARAPAGRLRERRRGRAGVKPLVLGAARATACMAIGVAVTPGLCTVVAALGRAIGLRPALLADTVPGSAELVAVVGLAPAFEEHLYRGRLLPALSVRTGGPAAVAATSVLFALPHLEPWAMLGAGVAGIVLGARRLVSGRVVDCVALHAGMNGAGLATALPADGLHALLPTALWLVAAALGIVLLGIPPGRLLAVARRGAASIPWPGCTAPRLGGRTRAARPRR